MAHSAGVTWTCDRCRRQITLEAGQTPDGWRLVRSEDLEDKGGNKRGWEICGGCYSQMERLLMNTEAPE